MRIALTNSVAIEVPGGSKPPRWRAQFAWLERYTDAINVSPEHLRDIPPVRLQCPLVRSGMLHFAAEWAPA